MTIKQNKAAVLRMTEAFNNMGPDSAENAAKVVPELLAEKIEEDWTFALDRKSHEPLEQLPPRQRVQAEIRLVRAAFPDGKYAVRELVAERNTVILLWEFTATHNGVFFGREPTGRELKVSGYEVVKFNRKGQIVGHFDNHLQTTMDVLAQAGVLDPATLAELGMPQTPRKR